MMNVAFEETMADKPTIQRMLAVWNALGAVEITQEMIEAGAEVIQSRLGGYDLGGYFSAECLAEEIYQAMAAKGKI